MSTPRFGPLSDGASVPHAEAERRVPVRGGKIKIVVPPFMSIFRPSLGASLLKASLRRNGVECDVCYINMEFAVEVGHVLTQYIAKHSGKSLLVGEWIFSHALYPDRNLALDAEYLELLSQRLPSNLVRLVVEASKVVPSFVRKVATRLVAERPAIVGFSSMFQTHSAALAIAQSIKEIDGGILVCFGGANCEGEMGRSTIAAFPQVDYVFSGDADETFPEFVRRFLVGETPLAYAPSIFSRESFLSSSCHEETSIVTELRRDSSTSCNTTAATSGFVSDLDNLPVPDYQDYFEMLDCIGIRDEFQVGLLVETSRGCWWGEKSHCKFCGLNGAGMKYRSKSPARILSEFDYLNERWKPDFLQVTDNILDIKHLPAFDEIHRSGRKYRLYYEVKANMNEEQLRRIALGGVTWVQAGVESLNDDILKIMGKGVTALQNIRLLRNCVELGIIPHWNILTGFPSEEDEQYRKMTGMIRYLEHLPPPIGTNQIRLVRFSPYFERASDFGYKNVRPAPAYQYIYQGVSAQYLQGLAYLFVAENGDIGREDVVEPLRQAVKQWELCYSGEKAFPRLMIFEVARAWLVKDTRSISKQRWTSIGTMEVKLLESFRDPARFEGVLQRLQADSTAGADVLSAWSRLVDLGFVLIDGDRALSLVVDPAKRVKSVRRVESRPGCFGEQIERQIAELLLSA